LRDHGQDFLVGKQLSKGDVLLLETLLMAEECKPDILAKFPLLQVIEWTVLMVNESKQDHQFKLAEEYGGVGG